MKLTALIFAAIFLAACGPDLKVRCDNPMTLVEARQQIPDFPFPASAHHIYYAEFSEWQEYECIVRFRAPPADCLAAIPKVMESTHHRGLPDFKFHTVKLTTQAVLPQSMSFNHVKWFDSAVISNGVFAKEDSNRVVNVWVDENNGVFYFHQTD